MLHFLVLHIKVSVIAFTIHRTRVRFLKSSGGEAISKESFLNTAVRNEHMVRAVTYAATFNRFLRSFRGIRGYMACIFHKIFFLLQIIFTIWRRKLVMKLTISLSRSLTKSFE
jgi:hypothetical protein